MKYLVIFFRVLRWMMTVVKYDKTEILMELMEKAAPGAWMPSRLDGGPRDDAH